MKVLNVGGGASRNLPPHYAGWEQSLLDIDLDVNPDICCDARDLAKQGLSGFDAVYCSHNLEHFYWHEVPGLLAGFKSVLGDDGFVEIAVPNISTLMREMVSRGLDLQDTWYRTGAGQPISFHDVLYGWGAAIGGGNVFYAHKCGFTVASMGQVLSQAGFGSIWIADCGADIHVTAYKKEGVPCP